MNHVMIQFVEDLKNPLNETDWEPYIKPAGFERVNAIRLKAASLIDLTNAERHLVEMEKMRKRLIVAEAKAELESYQRRRAELAERTLAQVRKAGWFKRLVYWFW